jgi:hypothetical protein
MTRPPVPAAILAGDGRQGEGNSMTIDEKIETLARAVLRLTEIMLGQPHQAPTQGNITEHLALQEISREMTEILQDR